MNLPTAPTFGFLTATDDRGIERVFQVDPVAVIKATRVTQRSDPQLSIPGAAASIERPNCRCETAPYRELVLARLFILLCGDDERGKNQQHRGRNNFFHIF